MHSEARTASDLVQALQVTKQAVSSLVDDLVTSGYVERANDPVDRRRTQLLLTDRGLKAALTIEETCRKVEGGFVQAVGALEVRRLRGIVSRLS